MYTAFYKLNDLPFRLSPDRRFFFGSESHRRAMSYLLYGIHQNEGFVVVTGDVGTGKTTLVEYLLAQLDREKYAVAHVVTSQLEPTAMLAVVASAYGLTVRDGGKAELLGALEQHMKDLHTRGKRPVLIIDEAQNLPLQSLEELRMLSNFSVDHKTALQVVLLGQPEFRETIGKPQLEQLRQRIIASHHLAPLNAEDTRAYIEHRLRMVGWQDDPHFEEEAFRQIYDFTRGLPREINRLCTRILVDGSIDQQHRIEGSKVAEIVEELREELPHPSRAGRNGIATDCPDLETRLRSLESEIAGHKKILRRALELAGRYMERRHAGGRGNGGGRDDSDQASRAEPSTSNRS